MTRLLSAYEGASFIVLEPNGDIAEGSESGLYHEDTRFLSLHTLRLDGAGRITLSAHCPAPHVAIVFASNPALPGAPRGALVVRRAYAVGSGLHYDLDVHSFAAEPVRLELVLAYDADFADVFQVKRLIEQPQALGVQPAAAQALGRSILALAHASAQGWSRRTEIRFSARPHFSNRVARFDLALAPGGTFHLCQEISHHRGGNFSPPRYHCGDTRLPGAPVRRCTHPW